MSPTYADLPEAVSHGVAVLTRQLRDLLKAGEGLELGAVERAVASSFAELGRVVMGQLLVQLDPGGRDVVVDGERHWQAVRATHEYMSAFGRVTVERGVYRAVRNGPTLCPMELRASRDSGRHAAETLATIGPA